VRKLVGVMARYAHSFLLTRNANRNHPGDLNCSKTRDGRRRVKLPNFSIVLLFEAFHSNLTKF